MLLRRTMAHVRSQNWLAVGLDFLIVVVGVFIGIQLGNWNTAREARQTERELIVRLETEFEEITANFDTALELLPVFLEGTQDLITVARGDRAPSDDNIQYAAFMSYNLGRPPLRSATYQQLVASGDLKLVRDEAVRTALVRYHQSVEQQGFFYPVTLEQLLRIPDFRDFPLTDLETELDFPPSPAVIASVSVDIDRLMDPESEAELERLEVLQVNLYRAATIQSARAEEVLAALRAEAM